MGALKVNGNINATGTISATSFLGNATSATNADKLDGYHFADLEDRYVNVTGDTMAGALNFANGVKLTSDYSWISIAGISSFSCPNETAITQPGGSYPMVLYSGAASGRDCGILYLSNDNAYIANSSDIGYTFGVFDTDITQDFSVEGNASFCVRSSGEGSWSRSRFGVNGINDDYNFYVNGTSYFNGNAQVNGTITATTFSGNLSGNAATASAVKDYNNNTLTYFGYSTSGMSASSVTWIGAWDASVSGQYRLRAVRQSALKVAEASRLYTAAIGSSSSTHATSLKTYFDNNKASITRNQTLSLYSSAYGNGSQYMGYFLSGYDNTPYGGFYVAHYNTPYYVGISSGTYSQSRILVEGSLLVTSNYGTGNPGTSTSGYGTTGAIYFKLI